MERPSNEALWSLTLMNWREKEEEKCIIYTPALQEMENKN